jgi:hypothetical protein
MEEKSLAIWDESNGMKTKEKLRNFFSCSRCQSQKFYLLRRLILGVGETLEREIN